MISRFFIDRPIFAMVLSIVVTLSGAVAALTLATEQYPPIAPPTVSVTCLYPGASAPVVTDSVAAPIEQQVNGVDGMMYMSSQCTNDGAYTLTVTFNLGTDLNMAQVLVQNRVSLAMPQLPDVVQRQGVNVKKKSPNITLVVNLISPNRRYDAVYLSNYATIQIKDELARLPGVGDISMLGQRDYSMRVWLDPDKMATRNLSASDVIDAIQNQNVQVAAGQVGQEPAPAGQQFQFPMTTLGRLTDVEQFADIVIKTETDVETQGAQAKRIAGAVAPDAARTAGSSKVVRLRDVARVELGAQQYDQVSTLDGESSAGLAIYQLPGSNALETADAVYKKMDELKRKFPEGIDYAIVYDTTPFIKESVEEVFKTLRDAIILVAIVVLIFLQNWRATLIPLIAVPVAIVGTFAAMAGLGYTLNNLTLFGLVLAIGIVVDDAIVVVENVERWLEHGLSPKEAARRAMDEVTGPVIAVSLVLCAVFVPCAFLPGITGQFFRQFAVTIAVSTVISAFNSLTLSPALAAILLKPPGAHRDILSRLMDLLLGWFFRLFNGAFNLGTSLYARTVGLLLRLSVIVLLLYVGLVALTGWGYVRMPQGFIPQQDKGYLLVNIQLPDAASVQRTNEVVLRIGELARKIPGVAHTVGISGQSILQGANGSNFGTMFVVLEPFEHRKHAGPAQGADAVSATLQRQCLTEVREAIVAIFGAPPVEGLGNAAGFKVQVEDRGDQGLNALQGQVTEMVARGNANPRLAGLFSGFRANSPQLYLDVDRTKAMALGVPTNEVYQALQSFMGSLYVNNFNRFGRTWQVVIQADAPFRESEDGLKRIKVRNRNGDMVPLATLLDVNEVGGPTLVMRYNMYPSAAINGAPAPGASTGEAIRAIETLAAEVLPRSSAIEWTELSYLQVRTGNTAIFVFALAVVLVFLVLAAQYESWSMPLAVILVVPMCILCSIAGVALARLDVNIFTQIGFVVLVGLASKNAILIVEFARQRQHEGEPLRKATIEASRLRLRPILMTSFAFILGVVPLMVAAGAGAEMRRTLGTAVFSGMLGVTFFGILLTPVFYFVIGWLTGGSRPPSLGVETEADIPLTAKTPIHDGTPADGHETIRQAETPAETDGHPS